METYEQWLGTYSSIIRMLVHMYTIEMSCRI